MAKQISLVLGATLTLSLTPFATTSAQNADSMTTMRAGDAMNRIRRYTTSDVAMARTIADSLVRALPNDATVMPEALFAKASIAPSAADAEKDYSRIVNEYRFAPRVPDALMRLAQLEGARNNGAGAMRHLDRLLRDHGESAVRSRASLMAGRLRLEMNDPARGCELLAAAWASAGLTERDVKDQAESLGAKCPASIVERAQRDPAPLGILRAPRESVSTAVVLGTAQTAAGRRRQRDSVLAAQAAAAASRRDSIAKAAAAAKAPKPVVAAVPVVRRDTVSGARVVTPMRDTTASRGVLVSQSQRVPKRDSAPPRVPTARDSTAVTVTQSVGRPAAQSPVTPATSTEPAPRAVPPVATPAVSAALRYAVQFAAYNDRPGAEQFAQELQHRGIAARVEGSAKPFRVRAGRFSTREEAEATLQVWRKPGQPAIVVSYP